MVYKKVISIVFLFIVVSYNAQQEHNQPAVEKLTKLQNINNIDAQLADIKDFYDSYNRYGKDMSKAMMMLKKTMDDASITPSDQKKIVKALQKKIARNKSRQEKIDFSAKQVVFGDVFFYDILEQKLQKENLDSLYNIIFEKRNKANSAVRIITDNFYQLRQNKIIDSSFNNSKEFITSILQQK